MIRLLLFDVTSFSWDGGDDVPQACRSGSAVSCCCPSHCDCVFDAYSKIATLRLIFEGRHIQFAAGHEALLNISYVALAVPLVILALE